MGATPDRRQFLQLLAAGAAGAALPSSIVRALAIPANNRTGTIADVEHIVILMQENRSFDHYFGTLRGVRGYSDPRAVKLASAASSVWHQPDGNGGEVLPFHPDRAQSGAAVPRKTSPMAGTDTHAALEQRPAGTAGFRPRATTTMAHYNRERHPVPLSRWPTPSPSATIITAAVLELDRPEPLLHVDRLCRQ